MIYWITLPIAVAAIVFIAALFVRHWKEIRLLDPDSIREEREKKKREELMFQRFDRMRKERAAPIKALFQGAVTAGKTWYHGIYLRLVKLEKFYAQAKSPFQFVSPSSKDRLKLVLDEARSLGRDLKYADAERRYLEALSIDQHCWEAYRGLGTIYLKQKMYPQAKETFEFLLQAKKGDDICFAALADIAEAEENMSRAEEMRRRAIEFRPRLPNRHAELAEFYLEQGQPTKAKPFIERATELDPKSARYLELSLETAILLGDRAEAQRQYDKLRLASEDRPKLQAIKEKIDAMGA